MLRDDVAGRPLRQRRVEVIRRDSPLRAARPGVARQLVLGDALLEEREKLSLLRGREPQQLAGHLQRRRVRLTPFHPADEGVEADVLHEQPLNEWRRRIEQREESSSSSRKCRTLSDRKNSTNAAAAARRSSSEPGAAFFRRRAWTMRGDGRARTG